MYSDNKRKPVIMSSNDLFMKYTPCQLSQSGSKLESGHSKTFVLLKRRGFLLITIEILVCFRLIYFTPIVVQVLTN